MRIQRQPGWKRIRSKKIIIGEWKIVDTVLGGKRGIVRIFGDPNDQITHITEGDANELLTVRDDNNGLVMSSVYGKRYWTWSLLFGHHIQTPHYPEKYNRKVIFYQINESLYMFVNLYDFDHWNVYRKVDNPIGK